MSEQSNDSKEDKLEAFALELIAPFSIHRKKYERPHGTVARRQFKNRVKKMMRAYLQDTKRTDMVATESETPPQLSEPSSTPTSTDTRIRTIILKAMALHNPRGDFDKADIAYADQATTALKTLLTSEKNKAYSEAIDYFSWRIDCSTLISELEGWRGCVEMAKDQTERHFALKSTNKNKE